MSDTVLVALIGSIPAIIAAFTSLMAVRATRVNAAKIDDVKSEAKELVLKVDGRLSQLLTLTGENEKAKGVVEGRAEEKAFPSAS